jgi:hypothetical protein
MTTEPFSGPDFTEWRRWQALPDKNKDDDLLRRPPESAKP